MCLPYISGGSPFYSVFIVLGIAIGAFYWIRVSRGDPRMPFIYLGGLVGGFLGGKLAFMLAEGWLYIHSADRMSIWLSGKSVMGALPGGWAGVELVKKSIGYRAVTGDRFARLIPIPLMLGRIGCINAGCCPGVMFWWGRWPAVGVEMGFQMTMLVTLLILKRRGLLINQHFHLYLICYGLFRFAHEFLRVTPKILLGLSGYQWIALATAIAACWAFRRRAIAPFCET